MSWNESPQHFRGKARLEKILLEDNWSIRYRDGETSYKLLTNKGEREYWPDILAEREDFGLVDFEVDGKKGHSTESDFAKMKVRDQSLMEIKIRVVRIKTPDLVGRRKQTDELIKQEYNWQLFG